ncbi:MULTISPECIES: protein kinase domain-containing protein [unclassified Streptomyces]|uniref:protein kinase domain-containing protein n=1 Tax=unclassified Streptomyces TaxID=2593676 RepID=UPI002E2B1656|nr:protein kinase [Streptomyces sp. NBC_00223]
MVDPNETTAATGAPESSGQWGVGTLVGEGRYRLTGKLGRGGMAEVFAAEDVRLGRIVAVKLLRTDLAEDPVSKARFAREAQAVAGLNHHAVVAVYDSGEDRTATGTVPYIVMELVEGHTIKDLLTGPTPPPVDQALVIVSGVLEALAYSHEHGIVHRDIKPANVIITMTGAVKVMDFGIARALHGAASTMTQTGMVMGTPQYLSPEQALGKTVDHRSDLYATGCLLYELLALRPPFTGESPLSVVYQHVQDDPTVPSQANERVPPELDGMVLRALAKQPEDRFQNAEEMRAVVGYAHQALTQQGGWTGGMWNTGAVTAVAPRTQYPTRPTVVAQGGAHSGNTAELGPPLLAGLSGGGHDDVHGYDGRPPSGGGGNPWLKPVLFAIVAIVVIALGVFLATRGDGDGGGTPSDTTSPTATQETAGQPDDEPTGEPTGNGELNTNPTGIETRTATETPTTTAPTTTPPPSATTTPPTKAPTSPPTTAPTTPPATDPTIPTDPPTDPADGGADGGPATP